MEKQTFVCVLGAVQEGFNDWATKQHNRRWWKRIDGTPIPNDLAVCAALAVVRMLESKSDGKT